jgi:hypothetical protein
LWDCFTFRLCFKGRQKFIFTFRYVRRTRI